MTDVLSIWWIWIAGALILGLLELLSPGFFFLGFAIGALGIGLIQAVFSGLLSLPVLLLVFAILSLIAWLALRKMFESPAGQVKIIDKDIND